MLNANSASMAANCATMGSATSSHLHSRQKILSRLSNARNVDAAMVIEGLDVPDNGGEIADQTDPAAVERHPRNGAETKTSRKPGPASMLTLIS